MPQKLDLTPVDDESTTLDLTPVDESVVEKPKIQQKIPSAPEAFLSSIYHQLSDPLTDAPSRAGKFLASHQPKAEDIRGDNSWHDTFAKIDNQVRGFNQSATEGIGDLISGLSSPANIGMTLATGGSNIAGRTGLSSVANLLSMGGKALAVPGMIHGASQVASTDPKTTIGERGMGLVELAGNAAGMAHTPSTPIKAKPSIIPEVTPSVRPFFEESTRIIPQESGGIRPIEPNFFDRIKPEGENPLFAEHYARQRANKPPDLPAEFQPADVVPEQPASQTPPKTQEQLSYELGRGKFNMGQDWPSDDFGRSSERPTATIAQSQGGGDWGGEPIPMYRIEGGPSHGSDVSAATLKEMGIDIPQAPPDFVNQVTGELPNQSPDLFSLSPEDASRILQRRQSKSEALVPTSQSLPEPPPPRLGDESVGYDHIPYDPNAPTYGPESIGGYELPTTQQMTDNMVEMLHKKQGIKQGDMNIMNHDPSGHELEARNITPEKVNEVNQPQLAEGLDLEPVNESPREFISLGDEQAGRSNDASGLPPKRSLENAPLGQTIIIRKEGASPNAIKRAKEAGYQYEGVNEQGHFKFKKVSEPTTLPPLESEVGEARPTRSGIKEHLGPVTNAEKTSPFTEAYNLGRGLMASVDFSGPLRQGLALIHRKEFWKSLKPMFQSWATEGGFKASQDAIAQKPLFRERAGPEGKVLPSFADDAGLKLTDLTTNLTNREEALVSTWAEGGIPLGKMFKEGSTGRKVGDALQKGYANTAGVPVRMSNRAYTAFLNNLRANTFESLIKDGKIFGADANVNLPLARELATYVNTATGRGSLGALESSAVALNSVLFSPRLIASRIQMLNPAYYIMASPMVRKEALKSLFAIAAAGNVVTQLGKMAGGEVSMDPTSSDFGKLKIGNTRIDPYGGFQQYIVAASRLMSGKVTSSTSGNEYDLNNPEGPYDPTHADVVTRFVRGKVHPVVGFAWSLMSGKKEMSGEPMDMTTMNPMQNAIAQRYIPILMQDMYQLAEDEDMPPGLKIAVGAASTFGMGQQTYGSQ